jgi:hypothetical protein
MLGRVVKTLLAAPSVGRIVILAQEPAPLLSGALTWIADDPRVATAAAGDGISHSVAAVAGSAAAPYPVLVTTGDHPLLLPDMVEAFIAASAGADSSFAVVERHVVEQVHPTTRRTWIRFSDGDFSGANLFALATERSRSGVLFWAKAERDRKKALKLMMRLGPFMFLRAATRTISLDGAARSTGAKLGLALKAVRLPFPEAAIDVDKPADLELAEQILARRAQQGPGRDKPPQIPENRR